MSNLKKAAHIIRNSDALIVTAGAGMGVDSGLPDFRGKEGFWREYPVFKDMGLSFEDIANPEWFTRAPNLAWGFYGHRRDLYQRTVPHAGFGILKRWLDRANGGGWVLTTNVDGAFQKAGFTESRICEMHGTIHRSQCIDGCTKESWGDSDVPKFVGGSTIAVTETMPTCPACGGLARPNILMFGDWGWNGFDARMSRGRLNAWIDSVRGLRLTVIECGAGTAIPSLRNFVDSVKRVNEHARLIRINVRESDVTGHLDVGLPMGALEALQGIESLL